MHTSLFVCLFVIGAQDTGQEGPDERLPEAIPMGSCLNTDLAASTEVACHLSPLSTTLVPRNLAMLSKSRLHRSQFIDRRVLSQVLILLMVLSALLTIDCSRSFMDAVPSE